MVPATPAWKRQDVDSHLGVELSEIVQVIHLEGPENESIGSQDRPVHSVSVRELRVPKAGIPVAGDAPVGGSGTGRRRGRLQLASAAAERAVELGDGGARVVAPPVQRLITAARNSRRTRVLRPS